MTDQDVLLAVLNSTPVVHGGVQDDLAVDEVGRARLAALGGTGTGAELGAVRAVRDRLQAVARGEAGLAVLRPDLNGVSRVPDLQGDGLVWRLVVASDRVLAVQAVLGLAELVAAGEGRLRPCANTECRLFLLDRSRAGTARWCSMSTCGNRLKARRHQQRTQGPGT